jgi:rhodanese-related sulfurtransferase
VVDPRQIPGAVAVALDSIEAGRAELPRNRPIILYCACPNEASAAKAARLLLARGYPRARPLRGGLDAWIAAGHGVEATPSAAGDPDEPSRAELTKTA